jgi:curved DNA-binding protein CbpA
VKLKPLLQPHDVLGIPPDADYETIKAAFRKAAKACHPDLNAGNRAAERRFRQLIAARRAILRNLERRAVSGNLPQRRGLKWRITSAAVIITAFTSVGVSGGGVLVLSHLLLKDEAPVPLAEASFAAEEAAVNAGSGDAADAESAEFKMIRDLREEMSEPARGRHDAENLRGHRARTAGAGKIPKWFLRLFQFTRLHPIAPSSRSNIGHKTGSPA